MRCDICKGSLTSDNIGYVKSVRGVRVHECKPCHRKALRADGGTKLLRSRKLNSSWLVIA